VFLHYNGSSFASEAAHGVAKGGDSERGVSNQIEILLLEDNVDDAEILERLLMKAGMTFRIKRVASESAFRREVVSGSYDIILADYHLPGFSGMTALYIGRELSPHLPFIFVTGSMGEERAVNALREGATDYIIKDRPERLPAAIHRALEQRRDAESRRRMQESLIRSEQRFHFAVQATRDVIWDCEFPEEKMWISESMTAEWGHVVEDGQTNVAWWLARIHPDDRDRVAQSFDVARRNSERWSEEYRFQRADGTYGHVFDRALIVRRGGHVRMIGAMQDITTRVEAERTVRELSRTNAIILENAGDGILALDRRGGLIFANPAARRILKWEELPGDDDAHTKLHDCSGDLRCPIVQTFHTPQTSHADEMFRRGPERFPVAATFSPIREDHTVTGCVVVFQDLEEQTRLEKQLEQSRRVGTLGQIAATTAHEFNNVLMGILPFAEIIQKKVTDPLLSKAAAHIVTSVSRGRRITHDVLRTTNMSDPSPQQVDLAAWLRQDYAEVSARAGQRVEVVIAVSKEEPVAAIVDPEQLHQVISNLVVNARDAMPGGGTITITADVDPANPSRVRIRVSDTGVGIASDVLPRIFEPLYTTKATGTGLGLSIVQQIVDRNHGKLSVQSSVGAGTTFQILLPRVEIVAEEIGALRVMIVEDDDIVGDGLSQVLEESSLMVHVVRTGSDAEAAAARFHPDVVILDLGLPDIDGTEVYERLASRWPDLPVIFSSGEGNALRISKYLSRPFVRFLRKPYDTNALLQMIAELTHERDIRERQHA
jgi:signal transduction histidine kinase/DNA-binding response OmpR family regulator